MLFGDPYNQQPAKGSRLDEDQGEGRAGRGSVPRPPVLSRKLFSFSLSLYPRGCGVK